MVFFWHPKPEPSATKYISPTEGSNSGKLNTKWFQFFIGWHDPVMDATTILGGTEAPELHFCMSSADKSSMHRFHSWPTCLPNGLRPMLTLCQDYAVKLLKPKEQRFTC